jgi:hypothetical protein
MKKQFFATVIFALMIIVPAAASWDDGGAIQEFDGGDGVRGMADPVLSEERATFASAGDGVPPGFIPINEITIMENPADEGLAPNASTVANTVGSPDGKEKRSSGNAIGGRFAFGNPVINLGGSMKIGLGSGAGRFDAGVNASFIGIGQEGYKSWAFEALGFYEWRFNISDDGILNWFIGPGVALGYYGTSGTVAYFDDYDVPMTRLEKINGFNVGFGAQLGLEIDLSFIDPDHSLYNTFKNTAVTIDIRPMFHPSVVKNYRWWVMTVGVGFRYHI